AAATRAGVPNERITLEGVGKTDADLRAAVAATRHGEGLLWVAVESADELGALAGFARRFPAGSSVDVLLRLNPDVAPETHHSLAPPDPARRSEAPRLPRRRRGREQVRPDRDRVVRGGRHLRRLAGAATP